MTKKAGRYSVKGMEEGEFEPGSRHRVLKNLLGIKSKKEIDKIEWERLQQIQKQLLDVYSKQHRFTAKDICNIHKLWLGKFYPWAGHYRGVNLSKGGFSFAAARLVPNLMKAFEKNELYRYTPCRFKSRDEILEALAIVHTELILIHPFREGNGRLARLLANFMALQADLPMFDFAALTGKHLKDYILAVQSGIDKNYEPMKKIFGLVLDKTLKKLSERRP